MPYNGSGSFTLPVNSWNPAVSQTVIDPGDWNSTSADVETGFSTCITKDGQTTITNNLPMSGFKHTGVNTNSGSTSRSEYASGATLQDGATLDAGTTGGTSTAYTATLTPAITAYAAKQRFTWEYDQSCGDNPTINLNSVGAKKIYKNVSGTATQLVSGDVPANFVGDHLYDSTLDSSAGGFWILNLSGNATTQPAGNSSTAVATTAFVQAAAPHGLVEGRLTLVSATPVTTTDQTAKTTLYYAPYTGTRIALYDGTDWGVYNTAEISIAVPSTTATVYDVFIYSNSGTPTLELTAWTSTTSRATNLAYQNGVLIKSGDATRRYLGSFETTSVSGQTEDSKTNRLVYNYYNRVLRQGQNTFSTNRTTTSTSPGEINSEIRINYLVGVIEDVVYAGYIGSVGQTGNSYVYTSMNVNGNGVAGSETVTLINSAGVSQIGCSTATYYPTLGISYISLSGAVNANTATWYSVSSIGGPSTAKTYLNLMFRM